MPTIDEPRRHRDTLLRLLPAICQEQPSLAAFLAPFETILFGAGDGTDPKSIDAVISSLARLIDPIAAPESFLPWLASWVGLTLHPDLDVTRRRTLIQQASPLYRRRGTKSGIEDLLGIVTGGQATVSQPQMEALRVGFSQVGETTRLGGERPHFFDVRITLPSAIERKERGRLERVARAFVDQAKPAHTQYSLVVVGQSQGAATATSKVKERL